MLGFFKKLFSSASAEESINGVIDEKYSCVEEKKNKLGEEEVILDEIFYIHDSPVSVEEDNMPSRIEEPDNVNTSQFEVIDQATGKKTVVNAEQASRMMGSAPAGIVVPGLGAFGPKGQKPQQARPTQQPVQQQVQQQVQQPVQQQVQQVQQQVQQPISVQVNQSTQVFYPPTEMAMVEDEYHIFLDLAGVKKNKVNIKFSNGSLYISGKRESNIELLRKSIRKKTRNNRKDPILTESSTVPESFMDEFEYKFPFKKMIDETNINAVFEDGILHITLPHRVKGDEVSIAIM
jgi:HSP20 family molecular chaperone IbpA